MWSGQLASLHSSSEDRKMLSHLTYECGVETITHEHEPTDSNVGFVDAFRELHSTRGVLDFVSMIPLHYHAMEEKQNKFSPPIRISHILKGRALLRSPSLDSFLKFNTNS